MKRFFGIAFAETPTMEKINEHCFLLSHLPESLTYHPILSSIKRLSAPPSSKDIEEVLSEQGVEKTKIDKFISRAQWQAEETASKVFKLKISVVHYWDPLYPQRLKEIPDAPWVLYYIGKLPEEITTLAVVGTRNPSSYGAQLLAQIIPYLKTRPLQIVSGLAFGIDALAHEYSCRCDIPNFAVLGSGLDLLYPAEHIELAQTILLKKGGLISEFPPGTEPFARNFPRRNRIISGFSNVVWIVQGAAKSGTLHTATHALSQGKTIAACPGDVFHELSQVPNRLIFDGAHCILQPSDLDHLLKTFN